MHFYIQSTNIYCVSSEGQGLKRTGIEQWAFLDILSSQPILDFLYGKLISKQFESSILISQSTT